MMEAAAPRERNRLISGDRVEDQDVPQEKSWIELKFRKRECIKFSPFPSSSADSLARCRCGRLRSDHFYLDVPACRTEEDLLPLGACAQNFTGKLAYVSEQAEKKANETSFITHNTSYQSPLPTYDDKWNIMQNTGFFPTDAYGTLEFQGTGEGDKAKYIRLAHDTSTDLVLKLFYEEWDLNPPKLVITVHGGAHNFQLQPKLHRVFCNGLIKAAKTTGAWIMTFGLNTGVGMIVGDALKEHKMRSRAKVVSVGVAPWGVVDHREDLIGSEQISSYQTMENPLSKGSVLHTAHSHFLLVDNGTEGRYDSELKFRRQLEKRLSLQPLHSRSGRTSVVCLVLEGGKNTINVVLESVRQSPPIPVIVCDGSGRAADLLSFAHQYVDDDGSMLEELKVQLLALIQNTFKCTRDQAQYFYLSIMECVKKKDLITVFRMGKGCSQDDIDIAILTATLKAQSNTAADMLSLALSWNRIDVAKSRIFVYGRQWPVFALEQAMLDALVSDRVDFVKLLMENGVSMHKFLTIARLEELYNAKPPVNLVYLVHDVKKNIPPGYKFTLIDIGLVIELLMGNAYRSNYTRKRFRTYYDSKVRCESSLKKQISIKMGLNNFANASGVGKTESAQNGSPPEKKDPEPPQTILPHFLYPFHELLIWAVLMKRQKMALFMWQQGEEAIAKALVASKLYKMMAKEAADDDLDVEDTDQLKANSKEFQDLAVQLLEICYHSDDDATQHLLTSELKQWSRQTCLSLAVSAKHREFIAYPCVQLLINDLWMGGLNERKNSVIKVIMGIILPPSILTLDFKTPAELQLMPQTMEEHIAEVSNISSSVTGSSSSSSSSVSSSSSSSSNKSTTTLPKPEVLGRPTLRLKGQDAYTIVTMRPKQLHLSKKIYEFYNAPITKFWMYAMAYVAMLLLFTFVCLVKMDTMPSVYEWIVISHVLTYAVEKIREVAVSEPSGALQKIKVWSGHFWNMIDFVTITLFLFGLGFRLAQNDYFLRVGKVLYSVDIVLWYIHLLNVFSVNKYLGPYIMLMGKMMVDMMSFMVLLFIVLCSFGVARQAILRPERLASWSIVKDVFLEPYFMLYGEVYAGKIDPCEKAEFVMCVLGSWIIPILMTIYLLVANILLINLLIAVFNNTFARCKKYSDQIWRFQRYLTVVEYELRPVFPPPITLVSYLVMALQRIFKRRKNPTSDRGLKLFLDDDDVEKLHDFEEECVDEYLRRKDEGAQKKMDDKKLEDRIQNLIDSLEDTNLRDSLVTNNFLDLHDRLISLEEARAKLNDQQQMRLLNRSRHNTGGLSDQWSMQEVDTRPPATDNDAYSHPMASRALMTLRHRRRARQDSEMSTASDWHPHNLRIRTISQDRQKLTPVPDKQIENSFPVRRTNSTGVLTENKHLSIDETDRVSQFSALHLKSQLSSANNEAKSLSCQNIMMTVRHSSSSNEDSSEDGNDKRASIPFSQERNCHRFSHTLDTTDSEASGKGDRSPGLHFAPSENSPKYVIPASVPVKGDQSLFSFQSSQNTPQPNHASCSTLPHSSKPLHNAAELVLPRNKSFNDRFGSGRKYLLTAPTGTASPGTMPNYNSITDQIDTTKWHEVYAPKIPSTPLENWWSGKAPDFESHRPIKFSDQNSLVEWEDDGDASRKKKGRSKHRKRPKRNKKLLSEVPEFSCSLQFNSNNSKEDLSLENTSTFPRIKRNEPTVVYKIKKSKSQSITDNKTTA